MSDPRNFYENILVLSYRAWLDDPLVEWKAKAASANADIMAERLFHHWKIVDCTKIGGATTVRAFRNYLSRNVCNDFGLVRDIHDGFKHMKLDRADRRITNAAQTAVSQIGYGEGNYGEGMYGGSDQIVIELDDGTKRSLLGVMQNVIEMWERLLTEMGL
jgi:hypothetical protein